MSPAPTTLPAGQSAQSSSQPGDVGKCASFLHPHALLETEHIASCYEHDGIAYDLSAWVRGVSRLERVPGAEGLEWKLLTLEPIYIRDNIVPVAPLTRPCTLDFSSVEHARPSYRYLTWLISLRGGKIRNDLPGEDDEESVRDIMERNQKWLAEG